MDWIGFFSILLSLLFIGFLSGIEMAFISANKLSIELKKKQGTFPGKTWGRFVENPARFIGTTLTTLTFTLVIYGLLIGNLLYPVWKWVENRLSVNAFNYVIPIRLIIEISLSTFIILFTEFICRSFFKAKSNEIVGSYFISKISRVIYWLFSSLSNSIIHLAEWILKYIINVKISDKKGAFSKVDLEHFLHQIKHHDDNDIKEINKEIFENALSLSDIKLRECLIPRKEIESIDEQSSVSDIKLKFIETKLSKIIIYQNNIDNIIGYVHHLDLLKNPQSIKEILHSIPTVPETMSAIDLMNKFIKERKSIAWVVDEFGGTAGIVTMEDLLEEIFGEIEDEYDIQESFIDKKISEKEFILSGRLELDFISQKYEIVFDGSIGAETLSGYIIQNNESIPKQKDKIIIGNVEFEILHVTDTKIETVKVNMLQ